MSEIKIFKYKEMPEKCSIYEQYVIDEEGQEYVKYLYHSNPKKEKYEIFHPCFDGDEEKRMKTHLMCRCGCKSFNVYNLDYDQVTIRCVACGIAYLSNAEWENENKG